MRIVLKLSGEVLKGNKESGLCPETCRALSKAIRSLSSEGVQIGLVIGGGNIYRGEESKEIGMDRVPADYMGMLATLLNGLSLQHFFSEVGLKSHVFSGLDCPKAVETYNASKARLRLEEGHVCIFVGGTGNPFFTTDSAAALRAAEIHADLLLKGTKVDGVYDKDPMLHADAKRYEKISYDRVLEENLRVMDATSFALCRAQKIPMCVFAMDLLLKGGKITLEELKQSGTFID